MRTRNQQEYTDKKRRIMAACFECYAQKGLHGTGISALAQAADVSKATLYSYFTNKVSIAEAALEGQRCTVISIRGKS